MSRWGFCFLLLLSKLVSLEENRREISLWRAQNITENDIEVNNLKEGE